MTIDNFIPILWSEKMLKRLRKAQIYSNVVNRDYEGEIKAYGDTVRINSVGPVTLSNYVKNTFNMLPEILQGAGQPLVIDQAKSYFFAIDDVDKAQIKGSVMDEAMAEASYAVGDATDIFLATTIAAGVPAANTIQAGGVASSNTNPLVVGTGAGDVDAFEMLVGINTAMNRANIPTGDRWIIVDPGFVGLLLIDPRFSSFGAAMSMANIKDGSTAGGENGALPSALSTLVGAKVYVSNNVPVSGTGVTAVYTILAGYKGAVTFADQIPDGQPEAFRLQTGFGDAVRGLHVYGAKVTRPEALAAAFVQYS